MDKTNYKKTQALITAVFIAAILVASASAEYTNIYGGIDEKGTSAPVPNAQVKISCSTGASLSTASDNIGNYDAYLDYFDCPVGSMVTVYAEKDGKTGMRSKVVKEFHLSGRVLDRRHFSP